MCDPLTIGSIILTGASVAANSAANAQVGSARTAALNAERSRQQQYERQASDVNTQAQGQYKGFQGQQAQQQKDLASYFTGHTSAAAPPVPTEALPASSSNLVVNEQNKQTSIADAYADKSAGALAQLRAFGQAMGVDSRATARSAGELGQINGFKAGSSGVVPYELDAASQAGNGMKTVGDILGGLAMVTGVAGLSKAAAAKVATTALAPAATMPTIAANTGFSLGTLSTKLPSLAAMY